MEATFDTATILETEVEPPVLVARSFWDVALPLDPVSSSSAKKSATKTSGKEMSVKTLNPANLNIILAAFFLFLSLFVGYFLITVKG